MKSMSRGHVSLAIACLLVLIGAGRSHAFDLQGHRGARGLAPENTLGAFARALEIGVTTLETDLAVTKDGVPVLSHDPWLNPDITRGPDGAWLAAHGPAINTLTLEELGRYDVGRIKPGSRYAQQFAAQKAIDGERIPTLAQLFELVKKSGKTVRFNIETKLTPDRPGDTPDPETFARLVVAAVRSAGLQARVTIQSFDWRTLLAVKKLTPEIATACLTHEPNLRDRGEGAARQPSPWLAGLDPARFGGSVPKLVKAAGCSAWSPRFPEIDAGVVAEAQGLGLKVLPWTVNAKEDMARIIDMKVDGLITDYPDRAREVMKSKGVQLSQATLPGPRPLMATRLAEPPRAEAAKAGAPKAATAEPPASAVPAQGEPPRADAAPPAKRVRRVVRRPAVRYAAPADDPPASELSRPRLYRP